MPLYKGTIVEQKYFKVQVEADSWVDAKKQIWHQELGEFYDKQWDLYDLEEVPHEL